MENNKIKNRNSKAKINANNKYVKNTYVQLPIRVVKGKKEVIQSHAETMGESLNKFVNRAIDEAIINDKANNQ